MSRTKQMARIMERADRQMSDPLGQALYRLEEWDRKCRELHEAHLAELAECRKALREALQ